MSKGRKRISNRKAILVFLRDKGKCMYCGRDLLDSLNYQTWGEYGEVLDENSMTIDHVNPLSKGGTYDVSNLGLACYKCNEEKRDKVYRHKLKKVPVIDPEALHNFYSNLEIWKKP